MLDICDAVAPQQKKNVYKQIKPDTHWCELCVCIYARYEEVCKVKGHTGFY